MKITNPYLLLTLAVLLSNGLFLLPYIADGSISTVFRYWDGPNYAYLAKTLYQVPDTHPLSPYVKPEYFAAHLPLYPLFIRAFAFIGYNNAMIFTTFLFTWASTLTFYQLLTENRWVNSPTWSAIMALFIPARYVIYHNVGATEAPFIFFISASLLFYLRGNYIAAFMLGGLAGITRITGILMGLGYLLTLIYEKKWKQVPWLGFVGLPLLATFVFYYFHYGNFFAYFNVNLSSSNALLHAVPFQIFMIYSGTNNPHAAEFYLLMYAIYGLGTVMLYQISKPLFFNTLVMYIFSCFIFHQDLSRYLVPLAPFAIVVAYDSVLSKNATRILALPYAILTYIYAWKLLPGNLIVDWVYANLLQTL